MIFVKHHANFWAEVEQIKNRDPLALVLVNTTPHPVTVIDGDRRWQGARMRPIRYGQT